jgi:hypothetical protein
MTEIKYEVKVDEDGTFWYLNGKLHREDGPAFEWANGEKFWFLNGKKYAEGTHQKVMASRNKPTCDGKVVEIDGKKYTLNAVK